MAATVLIIDDSDNIRQSLKEILEEMATVERVILANEGLQGFKSLREDSVDLVLCDLNMPGIDGFKFLKLKQSDGSFNDIPVIMLTGQDDMESKVRGFEIGASDYLVKPCHGAELIARVNVHLKIKRLQDELRKKNKDLEQLSKIDPLTTVANRRHFMETLDYEYHRSLRYKRPLSFLMMDIDFFKKVNDTHGHQAGDQALITVATTLKKDLRMQDFVARYGGEEFALLLPETKGNDAIIAADRCRTKIEATPIIHQNCRFSITISMGLISLPNERITGIEQLIRSADSALYEAKRTGRNRLVVSNGQTE